VWTEIYILTIGAFAVLLLKQASDAFRRLQRQRHEVLSQLSDRIVDELVEVRAGAINFIYQATAVLMKVEERLKAPETGEGEPLPEYLESFINTYPDDWARNGLKAYARELYNQHHDWEAVDRLIKSEELGNA